MLKQILTIASFASSLGFGIVTLCIDSKLIFAFFLSLAFLIASLCYFWSKDEKMIAGTGDITIYGHPEGNIIKRNK